MKNTSSDVWSGRIGHLWSQYKGHLRLAAAICAAVMAFYIVVDILAILSGMSVQKGPPYFVPLPLMLLISCLPLAFFIPGKNDMISLLHCVAGLALLLNIATFYRQLTPGIESARHFREASAQLSVAGVSEEPFLLHGKVVGVHVALRINVAHPITLDDARLGEAVLMLLNRVNVLQADRPSGAWGSPFGAHRLTRTSLNGIPLARLPGIAGFNPYKSQPGAGFQIPAGTYLLEQTALLVGLDWVEPAGTVCIDERSWSRALAQGLELLEGGGARASTDTNFSPRLDHDYMTFGLTQALAFRYRHQQWVADRAALADLLTSCDAGPKNG